MLNISNHPSHKWSEEQRAAAYALDGMSIVDVTFPNVDPSWDWKRVSDTAAELLESLDGFYNEGHRSVMVQGEFNLTYAIVERMLAFDEWTGRDKAWLPVTATTERVCTENADGTRTYAFKFVQFREYV